MPPSKASALSDFVESLAKTRSASGLNCPVCHKTFRRPVRYLACLHTLCQEHVSGNKFCLVCRADVRHCGVVHDQALAETCDAIVKLETIYNEHQLDEIWQNFEDEVYLPEQQEEQKAQKAHSECMNVTIRKSKVEICRMTTDELNRAGNPHKKGSEELNRVDNAHKKGSEELNKVDSSHKKGLEEVNRVGNDSKKGSDKLNKIDSPHKKASEDLNKVGSSHKKGSEELNRVGKPRKKSSEKLTKVGSPHKKVSEEINRVGNPQKGGDKLNKIGSPHKKGLEEVNRVSNPQKEGLERKTRLKSATSVEQASDAEATPKRERGGRKSATPRMMLEKRNDKGETALHVACRFLKMDRIVELLDQGADPNTKDNAGWTPLHEVCQQGSAEAARLLLRRGALPGVPGLDNETPLHEAVRYRHARVAAELLAQGADVRAKNIKGETPLSLADASMREVLTAAPTTTATAPPAPPPPVDEFAGLRVYCDVSYRTVAQKLRRLAHHHDVQVETEFSSKVSHVIVETDDKHVVECTTLTLQAVVCGAWLLSSEWVTHSSEARLQPFDAYEVSGICHANFNGPKRARLNRSGKLPGLFDGCHFYFHNVRAGYEITKSLVLSRALLTRLALDGGGKVLKREPNPESIPPSEVTVPYHAADGGALARCSHYILFVDMFEPMYNMAHVKALPIGWFIDCIQKFELCEPW